MNAFRKNTKSTAGASWRPTALEERALLQEALREKIVGHDRVIAELVEAVGTEEAGPPADGPAVLTFAGPADVGKRALAKRLARELGREMKYLNMTSFQDERAFTLQGLDRAYTTAHPGELTRWAYDHPRGILVVEGAERAHPAQQDILATLFSGFMTDRCGICVERANPRRSIHPPPLASDDAREPSYTMLPPTHMLVEEVDFRGILVIFLTTSCESVCGNPALLKQLIADPDRAQSLVADAMDVESRITRRLLGELRKGRMLLFERPDFASVRQLAVRAMARAQERFVALAQDAGISFENADAESIATAYLLALGPDVTTARAAALGSRGKPFGELEAALARQEQVPATVRMAFTAEAAQQLAAAMTELGEQGDPLHTLWRRSLRGVFATSLKRDAGQILHWTVDSFTLEAVNSIEDFQAGNAGIRIERPRVSFDDIAGHEVVKDRLRKVLALMRDPRRHGREMAGGLPKGIFLYGPPGTGKTLLAKALAWEAGQMPFLACIGPDLLNPDFTRALFARARRLAPAIVFIDEIDAIGDRRGSSQNALAINVLLTQIDGFDGAGAPVFVVAATNFPTRVDDAIVRAGRLDFHAHVPELDRAAREFFIRRFAKLLPLSARQHATLLDITHGMSGADLEELLRETQIAGIFEGAGPDAVTDPDAQFAALRERVHDKRFGRRFETGHDEAERFATACHEAGHAVAAHVLTGVPIEFVSIVPRGNSLGRMVLDPGAASRRRTTAATVHADIAISFAGSIAERELAGMPLGQGALSDLHQATALARAAVVERGLDPDIGVLHFKALFGDTPEDPVARAHVDAAIASLPEVQRAVKRWIADGEAAAERIVHEQRTAILAVAYALVEHGSLDLEQLSGLLPAVRREAPVRL